MGWIVAPNMAKLRDQIEDRWPGVVIGTIGDPKHATGTSGHNPDDTPGVRAELTDADSLQEVRALDPMIGPHFTAEAAAELVRILTTEPACRARLYYVIYNRRICSRSTGWQWRAYTGSDPHTNHAHLSGWAADDANAAAWPIEEDDMPSAEEVATAVWFRDVESGAANEPAWRVLDKAGEDAAAALVAAKAADAKVGQVLTELAEIRALLSPPGDG